MTARERTVLPRGMTWAGLALAVSMVFVDPGTLPFVAELVGEHAAEKLGALGALVAALGRALAEPRVIVVPADDAPEGE